MLLVASIVVESVRRVCDTSVRVIRFSADPVSVCWWVSVEPHSANKFVQSKPVSTTSESHHRVHRMRVIMRSVTSLAGSWGSDEVSGQTPPEQVSPARCPPGTPALPDKGCPPLFHALALSRICALTSPCYISLFRTRNVKCKSCIRYYCNAVYCKYWRCL